MSAQSHRIAFFLRLYNRLDRWRPFTLAIAALAVVSSSFVLPGVRFDMSFLPFFSDDEETAAVTADLEDIFGQRLGAYIGVIIEHDDILSQDFLENLEILSEDVGQIEHVTEVLSLARFPLPVWTETGVTSKWLLESNEVPGPLPRSVIDAIRINPQIRRVLLSEDGRKTVLFARLDLPMADLEGRVQVIENLKTRVTSSLGDTSTLHFIGYTVVEDGFAGIVLRSLATNFVLTFLALILFLWVIYRRWSLVLAALSAITFAMPVSIGLMTLLGQDITMINSMVPVVILIIGVADAVHMIESFLAHHRTAPKRDAIRMMFVEMGLPCFLTTVTTAAGFLGLSIAEITGIRDFGLNVALGIPVVYLFNLVLLPALLSGLPENRLRPSSSIAMWIQSWASASANTVIRRSRLIATGFGILVVLAVLSIPMLELDQHVNGEVDPDVTIRADQTFLESEFGGYLGPDIAIRRKDGRPLTGDVDRARLSTFTAGVARLSDVDRVESFVDFIPPEVVSPAVSVGLKTLRTDPKLGLRVRALINEGLDRAAMAVYAGDIGTHRAEILVDDIHRLAAATLGEEYEAVVYGHWWLAQLGMQNVVRDMLFSFAASLFLVLPILALALSNVRLLLVSLVPNLLPMVFSLAFAAWVGIPLRIGTAMVLAIALGIAVDDTIHLMVRLKTELKAGRRPDVAVRVTIAHTGAAILFSSVVLVMGFLSMLSNDLLAVRDMGVMAAATLFVAFLSDVYLAPALFLILGSKAAKRASPFPGIARNGRDASRTRKTRRYGALVTAPDNKSAGPADEDYAQLFRDYCKPKLVDLLEALGLNVTFHKAAGSYAFYHKKTDSENEETAVIDLVGGFGSSLFGHNNPELKAHLIQLLHEQCPAFVQGAVRYEAGNLARALNQLLDTKGRYFSHFANSGAEAVEAAMKHAYKVRFDAIRERYEHITRRLNAFYHTWDHQGLENELPDQFESLSKFRDTIDEHNLSQFEDFQNNPVVCAFKGSFHGKTTSALKLTFNKTYRESFEGLSSIKTVFFEPGRPERVPEIILENQVSFLLPEIKDNRVVLTRTKMTKVIGVIMEIILGEGGVKPVPDESLCFLADAHEELGVPYLIDEVQTGCGRTGTFAAYTQTPLARIEPEYLILGKALGGGLVKISAALMHERIYDPDFGLLHTSTFAEDELSCAVASKVLEMLTRDESALMHEIVAKGDYFMRRLQRLRAQYPAIIKDVRGRGMMLGLEFTELKDYGRFFRYAGQKGFVSLLVASYLLHHHDIRVTAPLSTLYKGNPGKKRASIIRLQPAVTITRAEIDKVVAALEDVAALIARKDEYLLLAHLIGETPKRPLRQERPPRAARRRGRHDFDARVGFVVNITQLDHLIDYYLPSFKNYPYDRKKLARWWNQLSRFLEPEVVHTAYVESEGFVVEANIVSVPYLAEQMIRLLARGRRPQSDRFSRLLLKELRDKVQDAAIVARDLGDERIPTSMVGLGAFTSIVTENGNAMNDYEIPVTTGNTYTTGLLLEGIVQAAAIKEIPLDQSTAAVVGASGNIGKALSHLLCFKVGRLYLVGRGGRESEERLRTVRANCLTGILDEVGRRLLSGATPETIQLGGLAQRVYQDLILPGLNDSEAPPIGLEAVIESLQAGANLPPQAGAFLDSAIAAYHQTAKNPLILVAGLDTLQDCDVVTIATNSTNARLIGPDQVKKGAIVGCASVPSNLSRSFDGHTDDYFVFDGGYARLPAGREIDVVGMPKGGLAFGCLSETLLLGFEGTNRSFAKGDLDPLQVLETLHMAEEYGFRLGDFQLAGRVLNRKTLSPTRGNRNGNHHRTSVERRHRVTRRYRDRGTPSLP